ncbi:MAG: hypothetical protein AB8B97_18910 [Granulosicoccus sp.]
MSDSPTRQQTLAATRPLGGELIGRAAAISVFVLFVLAALTGGEVTDRGLLPLVRFISVLMLALGIYTSFTAGRYCAYSRNRWLTAQIAAACIGLGGGFVWSATSFGAGFTFFMVGVLLCALLIFKEMERRTDRLLARRKKNPV